ncbi:MAG: LysR family transcriptional regulator [Rhizobiales bacterium]|nr:LysR family transcriptional regulator [Hyphomicrobiales bacterium]
MADASKQLVWDDFRLIRAIAEQGSLPAAAAEIGVNHSTVFRRLNQIEATLGRSLFERHRSGYAVTPAGEEVVALAGRLGDDIARVMLKLAGEEPAPAGELRVTTNDTLLVSLLTPMFGAFRHRFREIRLDIVVSNQALNLSRRDADVAIRATDNPPETLVGRRAARIAWALYGRVLDFPEPEVEDDLFQRPWVSLGDNLGQFKTVRDIRRHVAADNIVFKVSTVLGLAEAVEAGIGIGHLPCFIADRRPALRRLEPPKLDYATDLWLLTHPDLRNAPRVRVFLDFLAAEITRQRRFIEGGERNGPLGDTSSPRAAWRQQPD